MTIYNGALGRSIITPKPISLGPVTILNSSVAPIAWPADGGWTVAAGTGGDTAVAKAGSVVFAVIGSQGATVNSLVDTAGTPWTLVGQLSTYEGLALFRAIVPAPGWTTSTTFNLKTNWGASSVAMTIVNFAQCKTLPATNDYFATADQVGTIYDTTVSGTVFANSIQYAVIGAYFNTVIGPNPNTTGGWLMDRSVSLTNPDNKVNYTTFWRRAVDNNSTIIRASGGYAQFKAGWAEAGF